MSGANRKMLTCHGKCLRVEGTSRMIQIISLIPQLKMGMSEKLSHVPKALQIFSSNQRKYILKVEIEFYGEGGSENACLV